MITQPVRTKIKIKTRHDIDATGDPDVAVDRYLIDSADSSGLISVVEHELAPRVLAAPLHKHSREDEYTLVLEGRLGVVQDGDEDFAEPGELVFKPRDHWHTFWNAGESRLRVLEFIAPGGLEELFRRLGEPAVSTTRRHCRSWPRSTAARSISSAPCHWSNAMGWSSKPCPLGDVAGGTGDAARGRLSGR